MERPIILKAHEVRGILNGRQTQLRRIIKPTVIVKHEKPCPADYPHKLCNHTWPGKRVGMFCPDCYQSLVGECPFGQVDDRLWGRETWAHYHTVNHIRKADGRAFSEVSDGLVGYREDGHDTIDDFRDHVRLMSGLDLEEVIIKNDRWCPSTQMPRWASRILLQIVSVRVERLNDASEVDCRAMGFPLSWDGKPYNPPPNDHWQGYGKSSFLLHAAEILGFKTSGEAWEANPWVWVIEFKRVEA